LRRLLLLEDDPVLAKILIKYLSSHNYQIDWAKNGDEAVDLSYLHSYCLYLFDINVPLLNGIDLLKLLRDADDMTPTIIISALVDVKSVTQGFIAGADDYLKKPFDPEELMIRIKAKTKERISHNDFEVNLNTGVIHYQKGVIQLGNVQKNILIALLKNYPNPATKEELMLLLTKPSDLTLRVNISKIKERFNLDIKNVRGVGYKVI
jgi:DNA-binding response OmpR family regulator